MFGTEIHFGPSCVNEFQVKNHFERPLAIVKHSPKKQHMAQVVRV